MKVTSRKFQRDFSRIRQAAAAGESVYVTSGNQEFLFQRVQPKTWQGALKGKVKIVGYLYSTGLTWETTKKENHGTTDFSDATDRKSKLSVPNAEKRPCAPWSSREANYTRDLRLSDSSQCFIRAQDLKDLRIGLIEPFSEADESKQKKSPSLWRDGPWKYSRRNYFFSSVAAAGSVVGA